MNEYVEKVKWMLENIPNINKSIEYLLKELEEINKAFDELDSEYIDLEKQNKRYREAIEKALSELGSYNAEYANIIAEKILLEALK